MDIDASPESGPASRPVTRVAGTWKVGPLGRAIAGRGGAARSVDPGGLGVVAVSASGEVVPVAPRAPGTPAAASVSTRTVVVGVLAAAALVWAWTMGGSAHTSTRQPAGTAAPGDATPAGVVTGPDPAAPATAGVEAQRAAALQRERRSAAMRARQHAVRERAHARAVAAAAAAAHARGGSSAADAPAGATGRQPAPGSAARTAGGGSRGPRHLPPVHRAAGGHAAPSRGGAGTAVQLVPVQ